MRGNHVGLKGIYPTLSAFDRSACVFCSRFAEYSIHSSPVLVAITMQNFEVFVVQRSNSGRKRGEDKLPRVGPKPVSPRVETWGSLVSEINPTLSPQNARPRARHSFEAAARTISQQSSADDSSAPSPRQVLPQPVTCVGISCYRCFVSESLVPGWVARVCRLERSTVRQQRAHDAAEPAP